MSAAPKIFPAIAWLMLYGAAGCTDKIGETHSQKNPGTLPLLEEPTTIGVEEPSLVEPAAMEIAKSLERGEYQMLTKALEATSENEQWNLLEQLFKEAKDNAGLAQIIHSKAASSKMPSEFAAGLLSSFSEISAPKQFLVAPAHRNWRQAQEIILSPKYLIASTISKYGDDATLAKMWGEFGAFSTVDQEAIAMAADDAIDLDKVPCILAAAKMARTENVRELLFDAANRIVFFSLDSATERNAALETFDKLEAAGATRSFLLDSLEMSSNSSER